MLLAPAMNHHMYRHPATQANLELLAARGVTVIAPGEGELASHGEHGIGRMAEPEQLLASVRVAAGGQRAARSGAAVAGVRVLVTAGGTREPIDSVRYIGNRSSGRMGFALAEQAARRGAEVTLVAANVSLPAPPGVEVIEVATAAELAAACRARIRSLRGAADGGRGGRLPARATRRRPSSRRTAGAPAIELEPTEDMLSALAARRRPGQVLVGFAAEHGAGAVAYGRASSSARASTRS